MITRADQSIADPVRTITRLAETWAITSPRADDDRAARLLERLLTDAQLRARFRRDPAAVAREAQLEDLAGDFSRGSAMQTLETRESRSSLAGVMMAAALEGLAGAGLVHHAAAGGHGLPPEVHRVLARHQDERVSPAPAAAAGVPGAAELATPEGAAEHLPDPQAGAGVSPGHSGHAGVFPVVEPDHVHANGTDPANGTDVADDGGGDDEGDEDEPDENEPDENEPDDSNDALDEMTHDNDSNGDSGDSGDAGDAGDSASPNAGAAPPPADSGDIPDDLPAVDGAPVDEPGADATYPGGGADQAQLASWMASAARARGLPPELPVMAALTESGLRDVPLGQGDHDSVGFFQMRASVWDNGAYAGYQDKPELQLKWFLDKALEVKQQRIAQGQPVDDPRQYGDWIADVERPADEYRGRYQQHYDAAAALLPNGGAGDLVDAVAAGSGLHPSASATAAITEAEKYLGTPYHWGGSSPQSGFDCSGLVQWAFAKVGVRIPRTTDLQFDAPNGEHVGRSDLVRGDVVFFRDPTGYIHHEGIYLGDDKFLHAPHTGDVVKVSSLDESYYAQQFAGGRRFAGAEHVVASAAATHERHQAIAPRSVRAAMAAATRDADEARRPGTLLFRAVRAQEDHKNAIGYPDD